MNKASIIEKCKKQPYYIPLVLFEIYEDDDMIPEELVKMTFEKPEPREMIYYTGRESGKLLDEVIRAQYVNVSHSK